MDDYIKRSDALDQFTYEHGELIPEILKHGELNEISVRDIKSVLRSLPAADVVEVRHGRWMTTDAYPHHLYCSVCYKTYAKNAKWVNELDLPTNYCPNCGARMGKEDEHEAG